MAAPSPQPPRFDFTLRVTLRGSKPGIWRLLRVPGDLSLAQLHQAIQTAMGWLDCHLHEFHVGPARYGAPDPESDAPCLDERKFSLRQLAPLVGSRFAYVYDFGDDWAHDLVVEAIQPSEGAGPACLDGARACPPEDVGGIPGYEEFLRDQDRGRRRGKPAGGAFDPEAFSVEWVNQLLARIGAGGRRGKR